MPVDEPEPMIILELIRVLLLLGPISIPVLLLATVILLKEMEVLIPVDSIPPPVMMVLYEILV